MTVNQPSFEQERFTDYLAYFELTADPFDSANNEYFQFGKRRQVLTQLLHLCQFTNSLVVVVGESGVGKTSLKNAVVEHLDQQDMICEIGVPVLTSCDKILKSIIQQFQIPVVTESGAQPLPRNNVYVNSISEFVKSPHYREHLKLLLIEDAHNLDDETLQALAKLAKAEVAGEQTLHVVLFAEPQLSQRVIRFQSNALMVKEFRMERFSREELKAYLRFRLQTVGFEGIFPFKDEDLQFLWDISHGLPTAIHDAAREILIELATPPPEPKSIGLPASHMALLIALVAVLLVAVFYRSGDGSEKENVIAGESAEPAITESTSEPVSESISQPVDDKDLDRMDSPQAIGATTVFPPQASPDTLAQGVIVRDQSANQEMATATSPTLPKPSPTVVAPRIGVETGTSKSFSNDEQRLLALPSEDFTLQVLASGSEKAVKDYISRQSNRKDLAVFASQRDGKAVYIVVVGQFKSSDAARNAVNQLPKEQREAGPWPRSLQSVQAEIKKNN